jgi:amino acid adenylation domain-containing protein
MEAKIDTIRFPRARPLARGDVGAELERQQILDRNAATRHGYPRDACVHQLFACVAAAKPDLLAVVAADGRLSYGELDQRANRLANRLRALGVGRDTLVGLCMPRSAALVAGALGILKAGGAYVALDPSYPPERLAFMLRDAQVSVLVTNSSQATRLGNDATTLVLLDDDAAGLDSESPVAPLQEAEAGDLAYVIYTSGSSGVPKGVMVEHGSLLNLVFWHRRAFALTADDRASQVASPGFDAAVWELWPYLTSGASIHVPPDEIRGDGRALTDWLKRERITISFLPTALAEAVVSCEWPAVADLRLLLTGGDALHSHPSPEIPFGVVNNYGPTEGTVVATSGPVPPALSARLAPSIGKPIDNVRVYIVDEDLRLCAIGQAGELLIGGDLLARGYLGRPDLTAEKFVADPYSEVDGARLYRTGDLVRYRPTGDIEFLGRLDQQVKIRGYRIEPDEIAATLNTHPGVRSSVVVAREDSLNEKRLVAYAVPAAGTPPGSEELRSHLARSLPDYMVPSAFVWLDQLPVTANGKVDRAALPAPGLASAAGEADHDVGPMSELEVALAAMIRELLHLDSVGSNENFFVLGGHSLLGAQLLGRVRDRFGVEMGLRSLFEHPTVSDLASEVERLMVLQLEAISDEEALRMMAELTTTG